MSRRQTIAVDFDGVIHQYVSKWTTATDIRDPPMPGAFDWLRKTLVDFDIIIHSARFTPKDNTEAAWLAAKSASIATANWMVEHGLELEAVQQLEFWMKPGKPHALMYIDDRGYRFEGVFPSKRAIYQRPWKATDG